MNRVFVTRRIPEPGLDVLRAAGVEFTVFQHDEEAGLSRAEVVSGVRGCDVLLSLLTEPVDRSVLEANPRLLGVAKASGPESPQALALRLAIFERMLERSESTTDNMSETGILRASVKQTRAALAAAKN